MSDYDNGGQKPAPVKTQLGSGKNALKMRLDGQEKPALLKYDQYKGNPRIVIQTGIGALANRENGFGKLELPFDTTLFNAYLEMVKDFATNEQLKASEIISVNNTDRETREVITVARLQLVRNDAGVIFVKISPEHNKRFPQMRFAFAPSDPRFFAMAEADGNNPALGKMSKYIALGHYRLLGDWVNTLCWETYEAPEPFKKGGGGGYGNKGGYGGGNRNGGGGGYNRGNGGGSGGGYGGGNGGGAAASMNDDDMPF